MSSPAQATVYVVDDDVGVLGSLRFLLETDGLAVRTFRNAAAVLKAASQAEADCFVIDYKLPDINGLDLVGRLRGNHITAPVILITGYPDAGISDRAAAAGIDHVLQKPLLGDNLIKRVRASTEQPAQPNR
ncbi:MAG: response regulator [Bradyrhizobium sp.]|uniref:response regulator n=1 Tax=Bradyrhizobium sp. TaxID=376 RepID=UPI001D820CBF|nr:response regulator [Bradyrhizobium sp.]MBV9563597.1 response regulator [Bradyrhizobium sp.]